MPPCRRLLAARVLGPLIEATLLKPCYGRLVADARQARSNWSCADNDRIADACYAYTSGHWLDGDQVQRDARYVSFNFPALCREAIKHSAGATKIVGLKKIEGSFNKVLDLTTDTGEHIIARLPTRIAGPARLTTNSEVATIAYLRAKTSIALPEIIGWSDDPRGPVSSEYILMRPVKGTPLLHRWPKMTSVEHIQCIQSIDQQINQLSDLEFPAYGSLYCETAPLGAGQKLPFKPGFCIGPNCGRSYWNVGADEAGLFRPHSPLGACTDLQGVVTELLASAESRIPPQAHRVWSSNRPAFKGSFADHRQLLRDLRPVLERIIKLPSLAKLGRPMLQHPDLHKRNIFVDETDPTKVAAIIDWQSSVIEPAFLFADDTPDFARLSDEDEESVATTAAGEDEDVADETRRALAAANQEAKDRHRCAAAFDALIRRNSSLIAQLRDMDGPLFRLFRHANMTWHDGIAGLRNDLISVAQHWSQHKIPGDSPYAPTEEALAAQAKNWEEFEMHGQLHVKLVRLLQCGQDGWVSNEDWETASAACRQIYNEWITYATTEEPEPGEERMTEAQARALWPFNSPSDNGSPS